MDTPAVFLFLAGTFPSHTPDGKAGDNAEMVGQIAALMEVADDAEGLRGQVPDQCDVVYGSISLEAQAYGDNRQVWTQSRLEKRHEGAAALNRVDRSAG